MAGSGRTADILAEAVRSSVENQQLARAFATSGLLHVLDINSDAQALTQRLLSLLKLNHVEPQLEMFTEEDLRNISDEELS